MQVYEVEIDGVLTKVHKADDVEADTKGLKITLGNLKTEKQELADKLAEAKETISTAEVELAKAQGDTEKAQRLMDEVKAEKEKEHGELLNTIKTKEINLFLSELVNKHGAGGAKNEDLRDLLKSRYSLDYDLKEGKVKVSGEGVTSAEELAKLVSDSERYAGYRAASGAAGGGATGNNSSGVAGMVNPFKKETLNLTEQAKLLRDDPALAAQLKAQA